MHFPLYSTDASIFMTFKNSEQSYGFFILCKHNTKKRGRLKIIEAAFLVLNESVMV